MAETWVVQTVSEKVETTVENSAYVKAVLMDGM